MFGRNIPPDTLLLAVYLIVCGVLYIIFAEKVSNVISDLRDHNSGLRGKRRIRKTTGKEGPLNGKVILRVLAILAILWGIYVIVLAHPLG